MKKTGLVAMVISLGLASTAIAGEHERKHTPPSFADIDSNDDALISDEEFQAFVQKKRDEMAERDGRGRGPRRMNPVEIADEDGDGYLNESEFDSLRDRMKERHGRRFGRNRDADETDET